MTRYNVHIYREMRLYFHGIEAATPEEAARIAGDKPTPDATYTEDCDGENLAALVDVQDDEDYAKSVTIDFEAERLRKAAPELLQALRLFLDFDDQWLITTDTHANREHDRVRHIARAAIAQVPGGCA